MKRIYRPLLYCGLLVPALASPARGADVSFYGILKSVQYVQTIGNGPSLLPEGAYSFNAFVIASAQDLVTNATVRLPNNGPTKALSSEAAGLAWRFEDRFNTQAALDAAYPAGSPFSPYTVTMKTVNDGGKSGGLSFFLISSPPTPTVSNLAEGQTVDTTREFVVRWNSLGGSALDLVQVLILDQSSNVVFSTPAPLQPGALNGASTSAVIPANTLPGAATL